MTRKSTVRMQKSSDARPTSGRSTPAHLGPHHRSRHWQSLLLGASALILTACGGSGGGDSRTQAAPIEEAPAQQAPAAEFVAGVFEPFEDHSNVCVNPRTGSSDVAGSATDENNWLRSWSNELYLWYDEIIDQNPANFATPAFFDLMKTNETTPSGTPKDQFHFTLDTEEFRTLSQSGIAVGYGIEFALLRTTPPRSIVVAFTEPNSPATRPGVDLERGARILEIDGQDAVNGSSQAAVDALNAGLFPSTDGEMHSFLVTDRVTGAERTVTMTAEAIVIDPVQNVRIEDTPNGPVGYLTFNTHIETAESQLIAAMTELASADVTELVLDLRYNGGGLLYIANQVASMIANPAAASGRVFDELQFNDKSNGFDPVRNVPLEPDFFVSTSTDGDPLPTLNLNRVFVLSGPGTCSASETIINGLRGIDVEVVLIGDTTCGKPYGFYPFDNCGTTYFSVQFRGVNAKNFGDYADGFSPANQTNVNGESIPGCAVPDDFSKQLGDPTEGRFAAALQYMNDGTCPALNVAGFTPASATDSTKQGPSDSTSAAIGSPRAMPGSLRRR